MAKGFLADDAVAPVSASRASDPTATASTSIATTSTITPTAPTLINDKSPRYIGFDLPSLSSSKNGEEKKPSDEVKSPQQDEMPVVPSAPPITELPSYNTYSITPAERTEIIAALRQAKLAILHSRSKDGDIKGLSEALEEILSITTTASGRMSAKEVKGINEEIKKIMIYRNKMKERKKLIQKITNQSNPNGCLDIFNGIIMVSRSISDIFCIILTVMAGSLYVPSLMGLLLVAVTGCIFTYLILIGFCYNDYQKIHTRSYLEKIETLFCILYTFLYGVLATLVLTLPLPPMGPAICGYVSMVTCILQRSLKRDSNLNGYAKSHSNTYDEIMMIETGNNVTLQCNPETIIDITTGSTIQPSNDSGFRIAAVENLKIRIQTSLIELLGQEYMYREKTNPSAKNNGRNQENKSSNVNITANYTYKDNNTTFDNRTDIVSNTAVNYNTPTHRTNNDWRFFDSWSFWYNLNNPPIHHSGDGGNCCTGGGVCCDGCCICDDDCCVDDSTGNGGCCDDDGNCCEGDRGGCDDAGDCDI